MTDGGRAERSSAWLTRFSCPSRPKLRLVCFPHSGASGYVFRNWPNHLPSEVEVYGVHLPGRAHRLSEPCLRDLSTALRIMVSEFGFIFRAPFAFFGHSLGATLAFELARLVPEPWKPNLRGLLLSGTAAPQVPPRRGPFHRLPDAALKRQLLAFEGTAAEVLDNDEFMALTLPVVRADFEMAETWDSPAGQPLGCPLFCYGGDSDQETWPSELEAWRFWTSNTFKMRLYPGGHFYLFENPQVLSDLAEDLLARLTATLGPSSGPVEDIGG